LMDAAVSGIVGLGIVPFNQKLMAFGLTQQWQVRNFCVWLLHCAEEQMLVMIEETLDSVAVEKIGVVLRNADHALG